MINVSVDDVRCFKAFDFKQYESLDLNRLTVFAIWLLKENRLAITLESVTVALYKMFPEKFSLVDFPEYPDATRVNRALLQLKPKYRNWATGSVQKGFVLTDQGKAILEQTKVYLENPNLKIKLKKPSQKRTRSLDDSLKEVEQSSLYKKYVDENFEGITKFEIWDFLHAFPYTPKKVLVEYKEKIKKVAKQKDRDDILKFIQWVEKQYKHVFIK